MASENRTQLVDAQVGILDPAPGAYRRRPALTDARGVRRELASVYLEFRRGELDARQANTAAFLLRCLLEAIRTDDLEARLSALEQKK